MEIRPFEPRDEEGVIDLWSRALPHAAPHNDPSTSLNSKRQVDDGLLLVAVEDQLVVGTVMGGYDGHRGWIYSMAVLAEWRRHGIGSALGRRLEAILRERGCQKLNLQVRGRNSDVIPFYEQLGFTVEENISLGKRLYD